jgi:hypothetical protein
MSSVNQSGLSPAAWLVSVLIFLSSVLALFDLYLLLTGL